MQEDALLDIKAVNEKLEAALAELQRSGRLVADQAVGYDRDPDGWADFNAGVHVCAGVVFALNGKEGQIRRALWKVKEGTYGLCDWCGKPIPEERLRACNWAVTHICQAWPGGRKPSELSELAKACSDY